MLYLTDEQYELACEISNLTYKYTTEEKHFPNFCFENKEFSTLFENKKDAIFALANSFLTKSGLYSKFEYVATTKSLFEIINTDVCNSFKYDMHLKETGYEVSINRTVVTTVVPLKYFTLEGRTYCLNRYIRICFLNYLSYSITMYKIFNNIIIND